MEWFFAFLVGALIVGVITGLGVLALEDPEIFAIVSTFLILSFFIGWGAAHIFGWWDAWTRG